MESIVFALKVLIIYCLSMVALYIAVRMIVAAACVSFHEASEDFHKHQDKGKK